MKTPSFVELKTLVEYLKEELTSSDCQLQEIQATEDGVVLTLYRFTQDPRTVYLVFDLDRPFPFLGLFHQSPWAKIKKTKPVGLFLNAHAKNLNLDEIQLVSELGRVVRFKLSNDSRQCQLEFRLIPKQPNLIVRLHEGRLKEKSISWYPVLELAEADPAYLNQTEDEARSIPFMMNQWIARRGVVRTSLAEKKMQDGSSPYEKWKKQRLKDIEKKTKALEAIQKQIAQLESDPWSEVGEFLKVHGFKNLKPEWSSFVNFKKSVSENIQQCFEKAKSSRLKSQGAWLRRRQLESEIQLMGDVSELQFEQHLKKQITSSAKKVERSVEGRYRKLGLGEQGLVCYMGKTALDNMNLLRQSKAWDYWIHLKDFPSAHAILHRQKNQSVSDQELVKCATWLVKEGLSEQKTQWGGKFSVVVVECRHVRPIKGDKLGRVTYHEARELLIAL